MTVRDRALVVTAAAVVVLSGCGGSGEGGTAVPSTAPGKPEAGTGSPAENSQEAQPAPRVRDKAEEGGEGTPTRGARGGGVGRPMELRVGRESGDELQVHARPEHTFGGGVGPGQTYRFTVDMPGRVDVELHELHKTVATIQVR